MAYKTFVAGEEALAADVNSYLMSQTVARFTTAAQRTSQLPAPVLNQLTLRDDAAGTIEFWNGSIWRPLGGAVVGKGYASMPDANRTTNGLFDALVFTIPAFPYPVSMVANVAFQAGFGSALHTYAWDIVPYSTGTPIPSLGPAQAGAGVFSNAGTSYSWNVPANGDPTWKIRINPSAASAGNPLHTGGHCTWAAYG